MPKIMKENPESRQKENSNKGPDSDIAKKPTPTAGVPTSPEAHVESGFDIVKTVSRTLPADCPEKARQKNNAARDARTNLGRTIPSEPTVE